MPCYHPLDGYRSRTLNPSGKRGIVFNISEGYKDMPVNVPCGQCIGCRLERSRQWAIRCAHEASLYKNNCFLTLTYSPENLPPHNSLFMPHFQQFMSDLRDRFGYHKTRRPNHPFIKYFHCGEYGERNDRPHYHACLFNFDFSDKSHWKTVRDNRLYVSAALSELWPFGFHSIGDVTFESAAYVARYITKKITGAPALDHYTVYDKRGEIISERFPEYTTMSRRPGIGKEWFSRYSTDVYPDDFIIMSEKKLRPPRYYDKLYDQFAPLEAQKIKALRTANAAKHSENNNAVRLRVREEIQLEKFKRLKRSYEQNET